MNIGINGKTEWKYSELLDLQMVLHIENMAEILGFSHDK